MTVKQTTAPTVRDCDLFTENFATSADRSSTLLESLP